MRKVLYKKRIKNELISLYALANNSKLTEFFNTNIKLENRLIFNYFNLFSANSNENGLALLNKYFEAKNLWKLKVSDPSSPFYIKNISSIYELNDAGYVSTKKVSVILTTYNLEELVVTSINSLLEQTHKNIELILVDDASSDNTFFYLKKLK